MKATPVILLTMFGQLSLLAFGGGNTVLPEMQRQIVSVHHWMRADEFNALFALAQSAPGPNLIIVVLIGWHLAGGWGALASAAGMFGPSGLLTMATVRGWRRFNQRRWQRVFKEAVLPVTIGLLAASTAIIGRTVATSPLLYLVATAACLVLLATRIGPLPLLAAGALISMIGGG